MAEPSNDQHPHDQHPKAFWEERYAGSERVWSGRPNRVLADVAAGLAPGRALDLGCGEGADAVWLATRGWRVTGVDLSPTAVARARAAAEAAGVPAERARFVAADLEHWDGDDDVRDGGYDLVTASFLQSPVRLPREAVLARAAGWVADGGHLLVVTHAEPPPWASEHEAHRAQLRTPAEELAALALDPRRWTTVLVETRTRATTGPDGHPAELTDGVVLARRRGRPQPD